MKKSIETVIKDLEGLHTLEGVQKRLGVRRSTAIKKICQLRKLGYVKTMGGGKQPRLYRISSTKIQELGYPGLYDVINQHSPIKLVKIYEHRIMGKKLSVEEALVQAIQTGNFRVILSALPLFNKIQDWSKLYHYAKKNYLGKKVGALYDVTRTLLRVRRMPVRTRKLFMQSKIKDRFIIPGLKSGDFHVIENLWKVYIPFRKGDLQRYKE